MATREKGVAIVNIRRCSSAPHAAHLPQGLRREDAEGLQGRTLGVCSTATSMPFLPGGTSYGYKTPADRTGDGAQAGFSTSIRCWQKQADCIST